MTKKLKGGFFRAEIATSLWFESTHLFLLSKILSMVMIRPEEEYQMAIQLFDEGDDEKHDYDDDNDEYLPRYCPII